MCKLLMSINPEHVENILAGTKKFEFRKSKCKEQIESIVIYSTAPVMKVVAEVEVKEIIEDTPQTVWKTSAFTSISRAWIPAFICSSTATLQDTARSATAPANLT